MYISMHTGSNSLANFPYFLCHNTVPSHANDEKSLS